MKRSTARSPFPWFGGKQKLADELLALFPPHNVYVEVFGGGGSVLLSKPPTTLDVYNDRDEYLVGFFRALRDHADQLVPLLELTPYSRSEWGRAKAALPTCEDEVERARLFFVVASQSFGAMVMNGGWKSETIPSHGRGWGGERLGRMHLSRAASTANRVDNIWRFVERMRRVQIECMDWRDCLDRYDQDGAVIYLDPPYIHETRRDGRYQHELSIDDHEDLVERVLGLQAVAVISGYSHPVYDRLVTEGGFSRREFDVISTAAQRAKNTSRDRRIEVVWAGPAAAAPNLFTEPTEAVA